MYISFAIGALALATNARPFLPRPIDHVPPKPSADNIPLYFKLHQNAEGKSDLDLSTASLKPIPIDINPSGLISVHHNAARSFDPASATDLARDQPLMPMEPRVDGPQIQDHSLASPSVVHVPVPVTKREPILDHPIFHPAPLSDPAWPNRPPKADESAPVHPILPRAANSTTTLKATSTTNTTNTTNPAPSPSGVNDIFEIARLRQVKTADQTTMSFQFYDESMAPIANTNCSATWKSGQAPPKTAIPCSNPWYTFQFLTFMDLENFSLQFNHAYGEQCIECNNTDVGYKGKVGSGIAKFSSGSPAWKVRESKDGAEVVDVVSTIMVNVDFN